MLQERDLGAAAFEEEAMNESRGCAGDIAVNPGHFPGNQPLGLLRNGPLLRGTDVILNLR